MTVQRFRGIFEVRGICKTKKIREKGMGKFVVFGAAEKRGRDRFSRFLGSLLDSIFESRVEKKELDSVLFSETCFGSSPG